MQIYFSHHAFSTQVYGGVSRYYAEMASFYAKAGVPCTVVSPLYINEYLRSVPVSARKGLHMRSLPRIGPVIRACNTVMSSRFMSKAPAIYHETYYDRFSGAQSGHIKVTTVYDCIHDLFPQYFSAKDVSYRNKKITLELADHVFCISENTKQDLLRFYDVDVSKISVIPLAVRKPDFASSIMSTDERFFLFVGTRNRYKNAQTLFRAFAKSSAAKEGAKLLCFGGGSFSAGESKLLSDLGVDRQVSQKSGTDSELFAYYKQADAFIFPSEYEGFGLPTLEAMSVGCPVICSNTSSFPEVAGDAALYFDPSDEAKLTEHLDLVYGSPELRAKLSTSGLKNCERFSWERTAEMSLSVYAKLFPSFSA